MSPITPHSPSREEQGPLMSFIFSELDRAGFDVTLATAPYDGGL